MKVVNCKFDVICKDNNGNKHNLYGYGYNESENTINVETQVYNTELQRGWIGNLSYVMPENIDVETYDKNDLVIADTYKDVLLISVVPSANFESATSKLFQKKENNNMGYELPPEPKFYPNDSVQQMTGWSKISPNYNEGVNATEVYKHYELNLDKVKSVDDCKKILRFLCRHALKPIRGDLTYGGFSEVEEYFEADEI